MRTSFGRWRCCALMAGLGAGRHGASRRVNRPSLDPHPAVPNPRLAPAKPQAAPAKPAQTQAAKPPRAAKAPSTPESRSAAALALSADPVFDEGTYQRIKETLLSLCRY